MLRPKIIDTIVLKVYGKLLLLLLRENEEVYEMTLQALKFLLKPKENAAFFSHDCYVDLDSFSLRLGGEKLDVETIQSKLLYATFSSKISSNPTTMKNITKCSTQRHSN